MFYKLLADLPELDCVLLAQSIPLQRLFPAVAVEPARVVDQALLKAAVEAGLGPGLHRLDERANKEEYCKAEGAVGVPHAAREVATDDARVQAVACYA